MEEPSPRRALALSLHGFTGVGKNYATSILANSLFTKGEGSDFYHFFDATVDFLFEDSTEFYKVYQGSFGSLVLSLYRVYFFYTESRKWCWIGSDKVFQSADDQCLFLMRFTGCQPGYWMSLSLSWDTPNHSMAWITGRLFSSSWGEYILIYLLLFIMASFISTNFPLHFSLGIVEHQQ